VDADRVILHDAARKHFARDHLDDEDVRRAAGGVIHREPLDDEATPGESQRDDPGPGGFVRHTLEEVP
jgi:hypothetical protein